MGMPGVEYGTLAVGAPGGAQCCMRSAAPACVQEQDDQYNIAECMVQPGPLVLITRVGEGWFGRCQGMLF